MLKHIVLLFATCALINAQIQPRSIEFLLDVNDEPAKNNGLVVKDSISNINGIMKKARKICLQGSWVFYNAINYGYGNKDATAQPLTGAGPTDCVSGPNLDALIAKTVSIRALGTAAYELYPLKNFLAAQQSDIINDFMNFPGDGDLTSFKIQSLVISDRNLKYIVCGAKPRNCICADPARATSLIVHDLATFPANNPLVTLTRMEVAFINTPLDAECDAYANQSA